MTATEAFKIALKAKKRLPELESIIMQDAGWTYYYACDIIKDRWTEAEPVIMQSAEYAYTYACNVIKGRWQEAEPIIMQDAVWACFYAADIIKGRWLEAEPTIMRYSNWSYAYAQNVIKGRWSEAEENIAKSEHRDKYANEFFDEPVITKEQVDIIQWERKNLQGYFAPVSLFENKVSLLDMMIHY